MAKLDLFAAIKMIELHKAKLHRAMTQDDFAECERALRALAAECLDAADNAKLLADIQDPAKFTLMWLGIDMGGRP